MGCLYQTWPYRLRDLCRKTVRGEVADDSKQTASCIHTNSYSYELTETRTAGTSPACAQSRQNPNTRKAKWTHSLTQSRSYLQLIPAGKGESVFSSECH